MPHDLYQRVAATILAQLDTADPTSWSPPWHGADPLPRNALTGRRYRGINVLALWCAGQANHYAEARWATYRQWTELGAQVRKAERGTLVLFYKDLQHGTDPSGAARGESDQAAPRFVARASYVFNAIQVDDPPPNAASPPHAPPEPLPVFDAFVAATGAAIRAGGTRACYVPATDTIHVPPRAAFHTGEGYAGTLAHELVHWTGAPHRLVRDLSSRFGKRAYAAEELVAELGAAFVLAELGLARAPHPDHAAYCASWLPLLRAEPYALVTAAAQGSRAADFLASLNRNASAAAASEGITPVVPASANLPPTGHASPAVGRRASAA